MKIDFRKILILILVVSLFASSVSALAVSNDNITNNIAGTNFNKLVDQDNTIITIDGNDFNAQEFMNRVLEYTIESDPIKSMNTEDGSVINFEYNDKRQRSKKITEEGCITYTYDNAGNLKSELLPNGKYIEYSYSIKDVNEVADSISYQNNTYYFIVNDEGIITGLLDNNNQIVCEYVYDKNCLTEHIYELKGKKKIEHQDNSGDDFVGCVNSLRYDGKYYDSETGMFCTNTGSYYDTKINKVVGNDCYVNIKKLFGDKYDTLNTKHNASNTISSLSITSTEIQQLLFAASQYYSNTLNENTSAYSGTTWYTNFNSSSMYYKLAARIIYAENTYTSTDSTMNTFLRYNRQGIAWEITNRLLEDEYRYNNGKTRMFSSTTVPNLYAVLTYNGAFSSLSSTIAKGAMDSSNVVYQQAFWLACCIKVCYNFDQWNAIVARPDGVTSQCYNKGALTSSSSPYYKWRHVVFPGWSTDYTDASSYSAFTYYSSITKFNILHSYKTAYETLYIDSVYY